MEKVPADHEKLEAAVKTAEASANRKLSELRRAAEDAAKQLAKAQAEIDAINGQLMCEKRVGHKMRYLEDETTRYNAPYSWHGIVCSRCGLKGYI